MQNNVNNKIKAPIVLLIDENGENHGQVRIQDALTKATIIGLDLVEMSSSKGMPVCRIMDFGKWKYEQTKRTKKNKSQTQKQEVKELKFRPTTGDNDLLHRAKHADQFITKGDKVKLIVRFKGREQEHMTDTGKILLEKFLKLISVPFSFDSDAQIENNAITLIISPEKK